MILLVIFDNAEAPNKRGSMNYDRRQFLEFFGKSTVAIAGLSTLPPWITGCTTNRLRGYSGSVPWKPILPSDKDQLLLAEGMTWNLLAKWGDKIGGSGASPLIFGSHCDFTSFIPFDDSNPSEGYLWVNHEYLNPLFTSGYSPKTGAKKTKAQADQEMAVVGGSLLHIKKEFGSWTVVQDSPKAMRLDAHSKIPLIAPRAIDGSRYAFGTMANCAGGKTPWNTFLTCEENYDMFWGDWDFSPTDGTQLLPAKPKQLNAEKRFSWLDHYQRPPTHYGWVVEINPWKKEAKKLTALGRFAHECATTVVAKDGRTVVYMGDDANDECLYKFIADKPGSLETGTLYVANLEKSRWQRLTMADHPDFKWRFKDQTDLLVQTRVAAKMVGGTALDRPEDVEINPENGDVIVALTNNYKQGRPHGSLLRVAEKDANPLSMEFQSATWIAGGPESGLSCPDNLAFDPRGNLWVTTDRSESRMNKGEFAQYKNNGLYVIPMKGPDAGKVFQVASAPTDAELTGPTFSPDGKTLFLCVQHPGDNTEELGKFTSNWPGSAGEMPRSAVIAINLDTPV